MCNNKTALCCGNPSHNIAGSFLGFLAICMYIMYGLQATFLVLAMIAANGGAIFAGILMLFMTLISHLQIVVLAHHHERHAEPVTV
jgi:hypothetical protein